MPKITDEMPITIIDTSWRISTMMPMANSHPQAIDSSISRMFQTRRKTYSSKASISTMARLMATMLSCLIWVAFSTAITGPPVKEMENEG